jgi:glycine cleavage system H protein
MNLPEELNYSPTDEWLRLDGANATVGITDHAQRELQAIAGVTLPNVGVQVLAADAVGTLHSAAGDRAIHAPISGTIVAVNEGLLATPQKINGDPYGEGWIFRMSIEAGEEIEPLESAAQYRERLGGGGPAVIDL